MDNQSETKKVEKVKKPLTEKQLANLENMRKKAIEKKMAKKQETSTNSLVNEPLVNEIPAVVEVKVNEIVEPIVPLVNVENNHEQRYQRSEVKKNKSVKKKEPIVDLTKSPKQQIKETETSGHNGPVDPDLIRKLHEKVDYVVEHINEKKKRKSNNEIKQNEEENLPELSHLSNSQGNIIPKYRFNFRGV